MCSAIYLLSRECVDVKFHQVSATKNILALKDVFDLSSNRQCADDHGPISLKSEAS